MAASSRDSVSIFVIAISHNSPVVYHCKSFFVLTVVDVKGILLRTNSHSVSLIIFIQFLGLKYTVLLLMAAELKFVTY